MLSNILDPLHFSVSRTEVIPLIHTLNLNYDAHSDSIRLKLHSELAIANLVVVVALNFREIGFE